MSRSSPSIAADTFSRLLPVHQIDSNLGHMEFWLFSLLRMYRQFADTRLAPSRLKVSHVRQATPPAFRTPLGCDMDFGSDADE